MIQGYKKDKTINGVNSFYFSNECLMSDVLSQQDRLEKCKRLSEHQYWFDFCQIYWDEVLSQSDPLAHQQQVHLNLESMGSYILFARDADRLVKKSEYNIYKSEEDFLKASMKHDNLENLAEDGRLDFLLKEVQYIKDKTVTYKDSMLRLDFCKEYSSFLNFLKENNNIYKIKEKLNNKVDFLEKLKEEKKAEMVFVESDLTRCQFIIEILNINNEISNTKMKLKTIMYYYNNLKREIRDDVLQIYVSQKQPIVFKHVNNYYHEPKVLNFFDKFDIVEGLLDGTMLKMICEVGYSNRAYNHLEDILTHKAVYENDEAMNVLYEQINYYLSKIDLPLPYRDIFDLSREGKNITEISRITGISRPTIGNVIDKFYRAIMEQHEIALNEWYYLNVIKFKDGQEHIFEEKEEEKKYCTKCGELKPLSDFSIDSRNKDGRMSKCKNCDKLDKQMRRAGILL